MKQFTAGLTVNQVFKIVYPEETCYYVRLSADTGEITIPIEPEEYAFLNSGVTSAVVQIQVLE